MPVRARPYISFWSGRAPCTVLPVEEDARFSDACLRPLEACKYNRIVHGRIIRVELIRIYLLVE
jgi:hypothetical protein